MPKDANAFLQDWTAQGLGHEEMAERMQAIIKASRPFIMHAAETAGALEGQERDAAMKDFFKLVTQMDDMTRAQYRQKLEKLLGVNRSQFNEMLKAVNGQGKKGKAEDEGEPVPTLGGFINNHFIEILYDPNRLRTLFAVRYPDGRIEEVESIVLDGTKYVPVDPNAIILKGAILFPSAIRQPRSTADIVGMVRGFIHEYLDVDEFFERLATYYVLFTWVYDSFQLVPYLRALGDYGTGKSRLLETVGALCYRPIRASGAATTSPIFRMLDKYRGTLILDEADFGRSDEAADIIKILNTGNMKGVPVLRSVDKGTAGFDVDAYEVFGPKIIATRKTFADKATESRCLTKEMGGGFPRADIPIVLPRRFWEDALNIRNVLLAYRMATWVPERDVDYNSVDRAIEPRLNQITMALKTIVEEQRLKDEIDEFIREYNRQMITERSTTLTAKVVEALALLGPVDYDGKRVVYLKQLTEKVNNLIDDQNKAMGDDNENDAVDEQKKHGGAIKSRRVGEILRKFLQVRTDQASSGPFKKMYYMHWDDDRVGALCSRYGVAMDQDKWEANKPKKEPDEYMQAGMDAVSRMVNGDDDGE